jgi:hypothetical protein
MLRARFVGGGHPGVLAGSRAFGGRGKVWFPA